MKKRLRNLTVLLGISSMVLTNATNVSAHDCSGGTATCTQQAICDTCGNSYGEVDSDNHINTEIRDAKPSSCTEEGYSGDTYCKDCGTKISTGNSIPKNSHTVDFLIIRNSTCTEYECRYWICSSCKSIGTVDTFFSSPPLGHRDTNNDHYCDRENPALNLETLNIYLTVCGEKISECSGGTATCVSQAICDTCGHSYGEVDSDNHINTEIRDAKPSSCTEEGYSGDTYCKDCGTKISTGNSIPKNSHTVNYFITRSNTCTEYACTYWICSSCKSIVTVDTVFLSPPGGHSDTNNDHYCDHENQALNLETLNIYTTVCGEKISECSGGTATCTQQAICDTCKKPYGEVDLTNHVGDTEVKDSKEATCTEDGYTGDTYCLSCETKITDGTVIPALGHKGGTATCKDLAICETCNEGYGETNSENHIDDSEIRDSKEATCLEEGYSGDVYCKGCETKLQEGTIIDALGHVDDNNDNICDRKYCKNIINPNLTSEPIESPKPQINNDGAVKTGDGTPLLQIFILFSISGFVMCISILSKVKTHRK